MKKILDWHIAIIVIILLLTGFFAYQMQYMNIEGDIYKFIPPDHPARITPDEVEEIYQVFLKQNRI
jgi:predicted RND superfamily exporter protein